MSTFHIEPLADPIPAACQRMGIGRSTCFREIADGRLEAIKARGRTLITRVAQDRWLASLPRAKHSSASV